MLPPQGTIWNDSREFEGWTCSSIDILEGTWKWRTELRIPYREGEQSWHQYASLTRGWTQPLERPRIHSWSSYGLCRTNRWCLRSKGYSHHFRPNFPYIDLSDHFGQVSWTCPSCLEKLLCTTCGRTWLHQSRRFCLGRPSIAGLLGGISALLSLICLNWLLFHHTSCLDFCTLRHFSVSMARYGRSTSYFGSFFWFDEL